MSEQENHDYHIRSCALGYASQVSGGTAVGPHLTVDELIEAAAKIEAYLRNGAAPATPT